MISFEEFSDNLKGIQARMKAACDLAGRDPDTVQLLPVTKNHPVDAVKFAQEVGLPCVGENRVQEAAEKQVPAVDGVRWELIGHLQSNKAKEAVERFDRVQSVDSLKLLRRLDRLAGEAGKCLPILLQVNAGEDPNKFGFAVEEMKSIINEAVSLEHLKVEGLMTIAPFDDSMKVVRACFERLRQLRDDLSEPSGLPLVELSMGMTGDLEEAIAAGSTQIRVGTALFGRRT